MTVPRKVGADGRTTNAVYGKRFRRALGLPQGVGFCVPLPRDLLNSSAWLVMSGQCRKLIDALMVEHADHGGFENGKLKAPYDTLQARGMRRGTILDAIFEANALGIVDVVRGVRSYGSRKAPSVYRLTWLGTPDGLTPTNEWKAIKTIEEARARVENAVDDLKRERAIKAAKRAEYAAPCRAIEGGMKKIPQYHFVLFPVTVLELLGDKSATRTKHKLQQNWALHPSYIWWNCLLYLPCRGAPV